MTDQEIIDYVEEFAFETTLKVPIYALCPDFSTKPVRCGGCEYKAIAINLGHANIKVFDSVWRKKCEECNGCGCTDNHVVTGEVECSSCDGTGYIEPYDLMTSFVRRADKLWHVWLYSTKTHVDCGAISGSFGGHGDKGAAEFTCKDLPFEI